MKPIEFAPEARDEFDAAAEWYESHAEGLGQRFIQRVEETLLHVRKAPRALVVWEGDSRFRKAVVRQFPYVIFFRELTDVIEIVAVAHGAREPGYWLGRQ
jgi:toxin ParE1/3/4